MKNLPFFACYILLTILSSCSSDDDSSPNNSFFDGALTSATNQQLEGRWSIFKIEYNGQLEDVPPTFIECGRDFFDFQTQGKYMEYIFDDNFECTPQINMLNWNLSNGIIRLTNGVEIDEWVITDLTANRLIFKYQLDVDSDGDIDVFSVVCNRYEPPAEIDIYSGSFNWDYTVDNADKIFLSWTEYSGYNEFEKYEIYRLDESCNSFNAELISTITNKEQNYYVDETPNPFENLCYIFKIYTNEGLLGESDPITVSTSNIEVPHVNLSQPTLSGTTVQLSWEQYEGYYFSHYEVEVRNYSSGSGAGYQEDQLAVINNIATTNISVELPYVSDPVFVINVYNIFGGRNQFAIEGENLRSTTFERDEILPINTIRYSAFSQNETVVYYSDYSNLYRYNYNTHSVENTVSVNSSSIRFLKVFQSSFGTEVIINIGGDLKVYDANLNFKYNLVESVPGLSIDHLIVSNSDYWLITDRQKLYSFSRTNNTLNLINSNTLYNQYFSSSTINVMDIGQNRILVGNLTQSQGLLVDINTAGELANNSIPVDLNLTSEWNNSSLFSEDEKYVLNIEDNTLYSTTTTNLISTLSPNFIASGISTNGSLIFGTNNNPNDNSTDLHEKKMKSLSVPSLNEQVYNTKGYPQILFQNYLGQIISISKGLTGKLNSSSPKNDIFIEVIE